MSAGYTAGASCSEALKISSSLFQAVERNFHPGRTWIRRAHRNRWDALEDAALARFLSDLFGILQQSGGSW